MPKGRTADQLPRVKNPATQDIVLLGQGSKIAGQVYPDFISRVASDSNSKGPAGTIEIEGVETLPASAQASVENVGTPEAAKLLLRLPRGPIDTTALDVIDGILSGGRTYTQEDCEGGYILKSNGSKSTTTSGWIRTKDFIPVGATTSIKRQGSTVSTSSAAAAFAFYDQNEAFLGFYTSGSGSDNFTVGAVSPSGTAKMKVSNASSVALTLHVVTPVPAVSVAGLAPNFDLLSSAFLRNFYGSDTSAGYITQAGVFSASTSWVTTDFIPVKVGDKLQLNTTSGVSVYAITKWDKDKNYLGGELLGSQAGTSYTVTDPNVAFVRSSAQSAATNTLLGPRNVVAASGGSPDPDAETSTLFYIPAKAYAVAGEPLYIYPRNICPDPTVDVMVNQTRANQEVAVLSYSTAGTRTVGVALRKGETREEIGSFPVVVSAAPVSPAAPRNVIVIGESTVELPTTSKGGWTNEMSRRLTGVGDALLTGDVSPDPYNLSNIVFRGTRGTGTVKHEGRSGWKCATYLYSAGDTGDDEDQTLKTNAFWNPATSQFDMAYYVAQNGFGSDVLADGILPDGSNLSIFLGEGWNAVYGIGATQAAIDLGLLIDRIHATHPMADIFVMGLNPPPSVNFKAFSGTRWVSRQEIFNMAVKGMGEAYQAVCSAKTRCEFLPVNHVFDAENGYGAFSQRRGRRTASSIVVAGANDYVHPANAGMAMVADVATYAFVNKYCQ